MDESDSEGAAIVKEIWAHAAKQKASEKRRAAMCNGQILPPSRPARSTTRLRDHSRKQSTNGARFSSARTESAPSHSQTSLISAAPQLFLTGPTPQVILANPTRQVFWTRTNPTSPPSGPQTLTWTSPMVYSMLGFYICEVAMGKKPKSGFPDSTHQELAEELRKEFPEARHLIDFNVVKSKLTHSLKEDYDAFIACKQAPGFQYDPSKYEVLASDECTTLTQSHVQFHPHALKFRGVPLGDFVKLDIIFGKWPIYSKTQIPPSPPITIPPLHPTNRLANTPTQSLPGSHSKAVVTASGNDSMVESQSSRHNMIGRLKVPLKQACSAAIATCNIERAIDLYHDAHAQDASPSEALSAFKIFRDETSSIIFVRIRDKQLRSLWLQAEIDERFACHGSSFPS
ncbi:hypothetical protein PCASD_22422 [Puccinia coronata f. sp. avenae]|uniref:Uncharacterized protein n=1 Tax=Puccinia coronata f. sp. avenae TaxID=200324 RepID=A0A2N5SBB5_9BASI|nr:hypothetical protein PCASD_22422 [Puccinia coronata f. sp. avenae]